MTYFSTAISGTARFGSAKVVVTNTKVKETLTNIFLMATFSEVLKRLMDENGLKQKDIVDFLGVSKQVVSNWFTRGYKPELEQIPKLVELFGISTTDFFQLLNGEVNETTTTSKPQTDTIPISEVYQLQKKLAAVQEELIKYQAKELEEQRRKNEIKNALSPDQDTTTPTSAPKLKDQA